MTLKMIMHRVDGCSQVKIRKYKNFIVSMIQINANIFYFYHSPTRPRPAREEFKVMMILALHGNRVLCYSIMPRGMNIDHNAYLNFFQNILLPAIKRERIRRPLILHDNARPHVHSEVRAFMSRHRWEQLEHPPYSPDLNPCDFDGIIRIKRPLKGNRYSDEQELITAVKEIIHDINLYEEVKGIQRLPDRWKYVANRDGQYCLDI